MNKILIENYRGFDIEFDTNYEKFQCVISDENTKESVSFTAIKKFIDDYKKANQEFKPFYVEKIPDTSSTNQPKLKIVGIRKDGRFISENDKGEKDQLSDYDLGYYMLVKPENENILTMLNKLNEELNQQIIKCRNECKALKSTLNIVSLKDYKETLK